MPVLHLLHDCNGVIDLTTDDASEDDDDVPPTEPGAACVLKREASAATDADRSEKRPRTDQCNVGDDDDDDDDIDGDDVPPLEAGSSEPRLPSPSLLSGASEAAARSGSSDSTPSAAAVVDGDPSGYVCQKNCSLCFQCEHFLAEHLFGIRMDLTALLFADDPEHRERARRIQGQLSEVQDLIKPLGHRYLTAVGSSRCQRCILTQYELSQCRCFNANAEKGLPDRC